MTAHETLTEAELADIEARAKRVDDEQFQQIAGIWLDQLLASHRLITAERDALRAEVERRLAPLVAEIKRLRTAVAWQPMDTAPKDGTLILVWAPGAEFDLPDLFSLCSWHPDAGFCVCELRQAVCWKALVEPAALSVPGGEG